MFISRTGNPIDIIIWLLLSGVWCTGGWLISAHLFQLRSRERLFTGIASGLLLFIFFSNLMAHFFELSTAFWIAALIILLLGLFSAWWAKAKTWFPVKDLSVWEQMFGFSGFFLIFTLINFGLALFDDYSNLPLVSMIATGDVPPHFYLNPEVTLDYHYGMHLFAASMVRIAGLFPWAALDISKSLAISLTMLLSWLWFRRYLGGKWSWLWAGLLILFAGGARWLLLFVPVDLLERMSANIQLMGSALETGPDLHSILISPWAIEGDGPLPFPFAFISGMSRPLTLSMGGNSALPMLSLFLLLLLARRRWEPIQGLIYGLLLATLALLSEHHFAIIWAGIVLAVLIYCFYKRAIRPFFEWAWILVPSIILALLSGSALTSSFQQSIAQLTGQAQSSGIWMPSVTIRWPPALLSAHLGTLSLTDPGQILIALCEMGPVLLLAPWVIWYTLGYIRSGKLVMAGLSLMALGGFFVPVFLRFTERDRELARFTGTALSIWMILGLPYLWFALQKGRKALRYSIIAGYAIAILGGLALLPSQLVAIAVPQASYYIEEPDVWMSQEYWNQLPPASQVLDLAYPYRPAVVLGRSAGKAYQSVYIPFPKFRTLVENADPVEIAASGYAYVYMDRQTWKALKTEQKRGFQQPCVKTVSEKKTSLGDFRRLLDIASCK